jgi:hypothetical protein
MPVPIPQNLEPLYRALADCGVETDKIPQTVERLTNPPRSLHLLADPPDTASAIRSVVGFDRDTAADMLRLDEGKPYREADLTRSKRKRAERLWNWSLGPDELKVTPQGRPPDINSALVVYCARVICEACGNAQFKFGQPMGGGAPGGPMWRSLIEALPPETKERTETIADIVTASRSKKFAHWCQELELGRSSSDVAENPQTFRLAISLARRSRQPKRRI